MTSIGRSSICGAFAPASRIDSIASSTAAFASSNTRSTSIAASSSGAATRADTAVRCRSRRDSEDRRAGRWLKARSAGLTPSLVQAIDAAGERIELSLALADVFSGEIDFNSDLQPGDTFRSWSNVRYAQDGVFAGYGPVLAAEYVNAGRRCSAVRFTPPDGKPGYYDLEGRSLKRFFLKSPLKFEPRITSIVLARAPPSDSQLHPRAQRRRLRRAAGAPVVSVAGGVVTFAGWTGGGGTHGAGAPRQRLRERVSAPVVDCRRCPDRRARRPGRAGRPRRCDRSGDRAASALRPAPRRRRT